MFGSFAPRGVPSGINSAVESLLSTPLSKSYCIKTQSTWTQTAAARSRMRRLLRALELVATSLRRIFAERARLVEVHTASGRDFFKHGAIVAIAKCARRPVVLRLHGGGFFDSYRSSSALQRAWIRFVLRLSDRVVVLSMPFARRLRAIAPSASLEILPNAIDCQRLAATESRQPNPVPVILCLANLCTEKGHFDLLEAAAHMKEAGLRFDLRLAGGERELGAESALRAGADQLGLADRVEFLGPLEATLRDAALRQADILVLASHTENMPMSVIEGMAAGLAIVATRVGAVPELVVDGQSGRLVRPRDPHSLAAALGELVDDPERRSRLAQAARVRARERLDWGVVLPRTEAMYKALLGSPHGVPA
jgi:glycosyltransferase involved in cell wall biosynthesis